MTFRPERRVLDRLYSLADTQLGYSSTSQAEELEVDRRYLSHHVRSGNLERISRGVYRLLNYPGHPFEDVMATIAWVGDGAAASILVATHHTTFEIRDIDGLHHSPIRQTAGRTGEPCSCASTTSRGPHSPEPRRRSAARPDLDGSPAGPESEFGSCRRLGLDLHTSVDRLW